MQQNKLFLLMLNIFLLKKNLILLIINHLTNIYLNIFLNNSA